MVRMDLRGETSTTVIRAELELPVGNRRVQIHCSSMPYQKYKEMIKALKKTAAHKENWIKFCHVCISRGEGIWENVVSSDKKKFERDQFDGLAS